MINRIIEFSMKNRWLILAAVSYTHLESTGSIARHLAAALRAWVSGNLCHPLHFLSLIHI